MRRVALFAVLGLVSFSAAAAPCDRACLQSTLDRYLDALVRHDPSAAPLAAGFRQTENAEVRVAGAGLWRSATKLGTLQRRYFDAVTEQAGYFGTLEESEGTAIVTLRLKVDDRKISEAEWIVNRSGDVGPQPGGNSAEPSLYNVEYLVEHGPPERAVPKAERLSRSELVAIANSYFDGLTAHDGKIIVAEPGCVRIENGTLTTQRPNAAGGTTDCTFEGAMAGVFAVTARRYPIVDEQAGAVLGLVLFQRKPGTPMRRNLLAEWFFVEQGTIRHIYASMFYPDQDALVPNWPPFDGNWPIQPPTK